MSNLTDSLLCGPRTDNYGAFIIEMSPRLPFPKELLERIKKLYLNHPRTGFYDRYLMGVKPIILHIGSFLEEKDFASLKSFYNEFFKKTASSLNGGGDFEKSPRAIPMQRAHAQALGNLITDEDDEEFRINTISELSPHPEYTALLRSIIGIFKSEKDTTMIVNTMKDQIIRLADQKDLCAALILRQLIDTVPRKSVAEYSSNETRESTVLEEKLGGFSYLDTEIFRPLFRGVLLDKLIDKTLILNIVNCLTVLIDIKRSPSGLTDKHLAALNQVSDLLSDFSALDLEMLNLPKFFEDPTQVNATSFENIFKLWSEVSLKYLEKYPDQERLNALFTRFNELGKASIVYANPSIYEATTQHLIEMMKNIKKLPDHRKLLSGPEAKHLVDRHNDITTRKLFFYFTAESIIGLSIFCSLLSLTMYYMNLTIKGICADAFCPEGFMPPGASVGDKITESQCNEQQVFWENAGWECPTVACVCSLSWGLLMKTIAFFAIFIVTSIGTYILPRKLIQRREQALFTKTMTAW